MEQIQNDDKMNKPDLNEMLDVEEATSDTLIPS